MTARLKRQPDWGDGLFPNGRPWATDETKAWLMTLRPGAEDESVGGAQTKGRACEIFFLF